jgi:hypothetical protein
MEVHLAIEIAIFTGKNQRMANLVFVALEVPSSAQGDRWSYKNTNADNLRKAANKHVGMDGLELTWCIHKSSGKKPPQPTLKYHTVSACSSTTL